MLLIFIEESREESNTSHYVEASEYADDWRLPAIVASKMIEEPVPPPPPTPRPQLPAKLAKQTKPIPPVKNTFIFFDNFYLFIIYF